MGAIEVPKDALWRAQTQRAVENFPISGGTLEPAHIVAMARVKKAAARINAEIGLISDEQAKAIAAGADAIIGGEHHDAFPIDVFQTGSGTSSNMNINEVLASLAKQAGVDAHPNDQSTPASRATTPSPPRSTSPPPRRRPTTWSRRSTTSRRRSRPRPRSSRTR